MKDYYNQSNLLEQGWTKGLIQKYLGQPDFIRDNPKYPNAAPTKLYSTKRVNEIKNRPEVNSALENVKGNRAKSK